MTERSFIALVSAPGGFAGRTDAIRLLGMPTSVLRLVRVENGSSPAGGLVTYHVEAHGEPEPDAEHRQSWAKPGGPAELVAWGHPALDVCRLLEFAKPEHHDLISRVWSQAWLAHRPAANRSKRSRSLAAPTCCTAP